MARDCRYWITDSLRKALYARGGNVCVYCGVKCDKRSATTKPTLDHVVCHVAGGSNEVNNLVLACNACNGRRSDTPILEWVMTLDNPSQAMNRVILQAQADVQPYMAAAREAYNARKRAEKLARKEAK